MPDLNKFYTWCVQTCNAPDVGYSMDYRAAQTVGGITYYDCSSFVYYAMIAGGWTDLPSWPFTTYDMIPYLLRGGWHEVPADGEILAGDIGWNLEHVEVAYSRGERGVAVFMGAHDDVYPLPDQVSIGVAGNPSIPRSFSRIFRYGEGGASGDYGYTAAVVAALAGNAWVDSHVNPTLIDHDGQTLGLFQWHGTRKIAMEGWLTAEGYSHTDPEGQLLWLIHEDHWSGQLYNITSLSEFLHSQSTNIDELTEAFWVCWEGIQTMYLEDRQQFAREALAYIVNNAQDTSINMWYTIPMQYLSREQAWNNAVMMYRLLSAGGGGGGTPTDAKKKKKLWMWIRYHL